MLRFLKRWTSGRLDQLAQQNEQLLNRMKTVETELRALRRELKTRTAITARRKTNLSLEELQSISRAACHTAYLGNGLLLCRVLGSYLLYADAQDTDLVPHLCLNGLWEPRLTQVVLKTVKPGWCCLDVGANHGYYALMMAGLVEDTGRVLALEPNANLAQLVQKTLDVNGFGDRTTVMSVAASHQADQTVTLTIPAGKSGRASIFGSASAADRTLDVKTVTIDQLTADWERVDLIKIDTEGAEAIIWKGMQATIERNPDVIILLEFGADRYGDAGAFLNEILAAGFLLRHVGKGGIVEPLTPERCLTERQGQYWDLFLTRNEAFDLNIFNPPSP